MELRTEKQEQYLEEVIRLHYEKGYGERRIARIIPVSRATITRWISIFASENNAKTVQMPKTKSKLEPQVQPSAADANTETNDVKTLRSEIAKLQSQLKMERLRADAYDEMIRVAETRLNISIRKKSGAKQ